jgi:tellurite resistance protein TehA-like permease
MTRWCLAMVGLLPLITSEAVRPRLSYDVRRLATVFPFGMYAACSFTAGQVTGVTGIVSFGRIWTWVAFAVALLVLAGLYRHIRRVWRLPDASKHPRLLGRFPCLTKGHCDGS